MAVAYLKLRAVTLKIDPIFLGLLLRILPLTKALS